MELLTAGLSNCATIKLYNNCKYLEMIKQFGKVNLLCKGYLESTYIVSKDAYRHTNKQPVSAFEQVYSAVQK